MEALVSAGGTKMSIEYWMTPQHTCSAIVDDAATGYRHLQRRRPSRSMARGDSTQSGWKNSQYCPGILSYNWNLSTDSNNQIISCSIISEKFNIPNRNSFLEEHLSALVDFSFKFSQSVLLRCALASSHRGSGGKNGCRIKCHPDPGAG